MSRQDRLYRVVILCRNFAVNFAYYRVGQKPEHLHLQLRRGDFWRAVCGNFIDICVLEWCKLFGDSKGKHHWSKVVSDATSFENELLNHLGIDQAAFQQEIETMRRYRDKFLAHLDSDEVMHIPVLDMAKRAVWFYYAHVVQREAKLGELAELPVGLDEAYAKYEDEAQAIYQHNA